MKSKQKIKLFALFLVISLTVVNSALAYDTFEENQWYLDHLKVKDAWNITRGDSKVVVAVIDTGVDLDHPDLKERIWVNNGEIANNGIDDDRNGFIDDVHGWNFIKNNNDPEPDPSDGNFSVLAVRHGTFISGIIGAIHDNSFGIKGIAGQVRIMPLVALDTNGSGTSNIVAKAIDYAVKQGADIVNLSFGGDENDDVLRQAIDRAYQKNVIIIAAAGNGTMAGTNFSTHPVYPVCYDAVGKNEIIGVASLGKIDQLSGFSNYGSCVDISAPGEDITSTIFQQAGFNDFQNFVGHHYFGTSFATAMVSGTVALMRSIDNNLTTDEIVAIFNSTSLNIAGNNTEKLYTYGAGLLNSYAAVEKTMNDYGSATKMRLLITADTELPAEVYQFDSDFRSQNNIEVFGGKFTGLNITGADLDKDLKNEIITGATAGNQPFVRSLSIDGKLIASFLAFEGSFIGGVRVAAGDINNDGKVEYVVVPQSKREPVVRIFDENGQLIREFLAFDKKYTGGLTVALGNVTDDAFDEIIIGSPSGMRTAVRVFNDQGKIVKEIKPFLATNKSGANVTVGNLDKNDYDEIVIGAGSGSEPRVQAYDVDGKVIADFLAYKNFTGGVRVAVGDWNEDGQGELVTSPGASGGPHIKILDLKGGLLGEFFAFSSSFTKGVQVMIR